MSYYRDRALHHRRWGEKGSEVLDSRRSFRRPPFSFLLLTLLRLLHHACLPPVRNAERAEDSGARETDTRILNLNRQLRGQEPDYP